jgi:hypothetical protein
MFSLTANYRRYAGLLAFGAGVAALLSSDLASAREDYCLNPGTGTLNVEATNAFRRFQAQNDPAVMRALKGTWLSTTVSAATNQISYLYESFDTNGLYGYTNYVCTLQNTFCSQYVGTGVYAVRAKSTNSFFGSKIVSDTVRLDHACLSLGGTFRNAKTWVSGGVKHTRVQK